MKQATLDAKINVVNEIQEKFKNAGSSVVVEYRGLTVAEVSELRNLLRAEGVELKVYKNSMVTRATEAAGYSELKETLTGPNAFAFGEDAVAPSRVLAKFAKDHEALVLKGGVVEGKVVGIETIQELSSLPSREGLLSMLLGCLQSPVRDFACIVKAVADAQGNGTSEEVKAEETVEVKAEETVEVKAEETVEVKTETVVEETPVETPAAVAEETTA